MSFAIDTAFDYLKRGHSHSRLAHAYLVTGPTGSGKHELASRQMRNFGGMVSFALTGGIDEARRFMETVEVFQLAESLGAVESLVNHPALMTHASVPAETRAELGISDSLVRLSVGIEDIDDLLADLGAALEAARG